MTPDKERKIKLVALEDMRENFRDEHGKPFLVRCPVCLRENYACYVAARQCAWCGWVDTAKVQSLNGTEEQK